MLELAQVGDRVFSLNFGWGTVFSLNYSDKLPLGVEFKDGDHIFIEGYKPDGKLASASPFPDLYWDIPAIEVPPPPKREKRKIKKKVWYNVYFEDGEVKVGDIYEDRKVAGNLGRSDRDYIRTDCIEIEVEE